MGYLSLEYYSQQCAAYLVIVMANEIIMAQVKVLDETFREEDSIHDKRRLQSVDSAPL